MSTKTLNNCNVASEILLIDVTHVTLHVINTKKVIV